MKRQGRINVKIICRLSTIAVGCLLAVCGLSNTDSEGREVKKPVGVLKTLPSDQRCLLARVVGREMRDFLSWIDHEHVKGVMTEDGFDLLIVAPGGEEMRSLFEAGELCTFSLERTTPPGGRLVVRIAQDPPALLPPGRAYALLFTSEVTPGKRWQFEWPLADQGYRGCQEPSPRDEEASVDNCRHGGFVHGVSAPRLRIVVAKRSWGFEAEKASLDFNLWSANKRSEP